MVAKTIVKLRVEKAVRFVGWLGAALASPATFAKDSWQVEPVPHAIPEWQEIHTAAKVALRMLKREFKALEFDRR